MLPGLSGLEILRRLRASEKTSPLPVLMLTAKGEEVDRIVGLELERRRLPPQALLPRELVARVKALLGRAGRASGGRTGFAVRGRDARSFAPRSSGGIPRSRTHLKGIRPAGAFYAERGPCLHAGGPPRPGLGYDFPGNTRTVDVHINRLRKKIPSLAPNLTAVRSLGYSWRKKRRDDLPAAPPPLPQERRVIVPGRVRRHGRLRRDRRPALPPGPLRRSPLGLPPRHGDWLSRRPSPLALPRRPDRRTDHPAY